jgi:hypothetical protein
MKRVRDHYDFSVPLVRQVRRITYFDSKLSNGRLPGHLSVQREPRYT